MPQRTRTHVLESLSKDALSRLLTGPLGWVVRDVPIDYGIDLEVEIFDEGKTTGLTFKVQLKGMESPDAIGPYRDIRIDHLQYWTRLDVPVLLVAYDDSTSSVYGKWIHSLDFDLKPNQKSKRIRFGPDDDITSGDPRLQRTVETVRRLKSGQFVRPFPVRFDGPDAQAATHTFFDLVDALGLRDFVRLDRADFAFSVSLPGDEVRVALPGDVGSISLLRSPHDAVEDALRDSMLMLAALLVRLNRFGESAQIVRRLVGNARATTTPDLAFELGTAAHEVTDHDLLIDLTVEALSRQAPGAAQIYLLALRQTSGTAWLDPARATLEPVIRDSIDVAVARGAAGQAAFWAYNYAQFLFTKGAKQDAGNWIQRAVDLDPHGYGRVPNPNGSSEPSHGSPET